MHSEIHARGGRDVSNKPAQISIPVSRHAPNDGRPRDVELLFDGDAPQRKNHRRRESVKDDEPVPCQKREPHPGAQGDVLARNNPLQNHCEREKRKVQRPDAQNASYVERAHIERTDQVFFAEQEFGDQVRAENEEQAYAEGTGRAYAANASSRERRHSELCPERGSCGKAWCRNTIRNAKKRSTSSSGW